MTLRSILTFMFLINHTLIFCNKDAYSTNESVDGLDTISDFTNKLDGKDHNWQYAIRSEAEQKFKVFSNLQLMFEGVADNH